MGREGEKHGKIKKNNFRVSFSKCNIKFKSHTWINKFDYIKLGIFAQYARESVGEVRMQGISWGKYLQHFGSKKECSFS